MKNYGIGIKNEIYYCQNSCEELSRSHQKKTPINKVEEDKSERTHMQKLERWKPRGQKTKKQSFFHAEIVES